MHNFTIFVLLFCCCCFTFIQCRNIISSTQEKKEIPVEPWNVYIPGEAYTQETTNADYSKRNIENLASISSRYSAYANIKPSITLGMGGDYARGYYVVLQVGLPKQNLRIMLDQVSAHLIVTTDRCKECYRAWRRYQPAKSSTAIVLPCYRCKEVLEGFDWSCHQARDQCRFVTPFDCNVQVTHYNGTDYDEDHDLNMCMSKGTIWEDEISFGQFTSAVPIWGVTKQTKDPITKKNRPYVDGYLGLGWHDSTTFSAFQKGVDGYLPDGFGFCFHQRACCGKYPRSGKFVVGQPDRLLFDEHSDIEWVSLKPSRIDYGVFYTIQLKSFMVDGEQIISESELAEMEIVLDPTFHGIGVPVRYYDLIVDNYIVEKHEDFWPLPLLGGQSVSLLSEDFLDLPTLSFTLENDQTIDIKSVEYVRPSNKDGEFYFGLGPLVQDDDENDDDESRERIILGIPAFWEYYTHYDRANRLFGYVKKNAKACASAKLSSLYIYDEESD